jgi:hypothetical protein
LQAIEGRMAEALKRGDTRVFPAGGIVCIKGFPPHLVQAVRSCRFYDQSISYALGYCVQGQYAQVSVLVIDDAGASARASTGFTCE